MGGFFGLDSLIHYEPQSIVQIRFQKIISPKIQRIILQKEIATFQRGCFEITYVEGKIITFLQRNCHL